MIDISGVRKGIYRVPMFMSVVYGITPRLLHSASGFSAVFVSPKVSYKKYVHMTDG